MKTVFTMNVSFLIIMLVVTWLVPETFNRLDGQPNYITQEDSSMLNYMRRADSTCQRLQNLMTNDEQPRSWLPVFRRDYKHMETMMYAADMKVVKYPELA